MKPPIPMWFDEIAQEVTEGPYSIIVPVCEDDYQASQLCEWLDVAVPAFAPMRVERVSADDLLVVVEQASQSSDSVALIVGDATKCSDAELSNRFTRWNMARDALRVHLRSEEKPTVRRTLVLVVSHRPFRSVAADTRDLLSIAHVMTVSDEPIAFDPSDQELVQPEEALIAEFEAKHGLTTEQMLASLYENLALPVAVPPEDIHRWQLAEQRLRRVRHAV